MRTQYLCLCVIWAAGCTSKSTETSIPNGNELVSISTNPEIEKINNDPPTAVVESQIKQNTWTGVSVTLPFYKKIEFALAEVAQQPANIATEKKFEAYLSQLYTPEVRYNWAERNGAGTFFYSKKVDSLLKLKKQPGSYDEMYDEYDVINKNMLQKLNARDVLYYCLAHPCSYYQNCNIGGAFPLDGKIYLVRYLPVPEAARGLSQLQKKQVIAQKDSVALLLNRGLMHRDSIDLDYLSLIQTTQLWQTIPLLAEKSDFRKNPYIYTVLFNLMEKASYKPFIQSELYRTIFSNMDNAGFGGEVVMTPVTAQKLVSYAMAFYNDSKKWKELKEKHHS